MSIFSWIPIEEFGKEEIEINDEMLNRTFSASRDCLVFIRNLEIESIRLPYLRADGDGKWSSELKGHRTESFNEKILDWNFLRKSEKEGRIKILYCSVAQDLRETSRFDLLDID